MPGIRTSLRYSIKQRRKNRNGRSSEKALYRLNALKLNEAVAVLYYMRANIWMNGLYINGVYKCRKTIRRICDRGVVVWPGGRTAKIEYLLCISRTIY